MGTIVINDKYEECRKKLKESIGNRRYLHSIGVSNTGACLAMRYGYDIDKAYLAGLLHDCAKGLKEVQLLETVRKEGIELTEIEENNPDLLHAKAGKVIAKRDYGINDEDILSSIYYHTTGKPDMSLLEKIIFVADYIEPNRFKLPGLDIIRKMSYTDLDGAICLILDNTLKYLGEGTKAVDPMTRQTYEFYKKQ